MSEKIQMVDLVALHREIEEELTQALLDVYSSGHYIGGPEVTRFEAALAHYLGVPHVVACGNGTDALMIALMALELPSDAEILTPSFTFVSTAEVAKLLRCPLRFVDVELDSFNISLEKVLEVASNKTRVIIPVHLFGQGVNMEPLVEWAEDKGILIVEDTAQALGTQIRMGSEWRFAGTIGIIGTTSFYPSKNLSCMGDGGAIFTSNAELARKLNSIAKHGMAGERYFYERIGVNSRLDAIQAAILRVKLNYLDQYNERRRKWAKRYTEAFSDLEEVITPVELPHSTHIYHQYTLRVLNGKRDGLREYLHAHEIPTMIYYPVPLHLQAPYRTGQTLPNTERLAQEVLSLPMHPALTEAQQDFIIEKVRAYFRKK